MVHESHGYELIKDHGHSASARAKRKSSGPQATGHRLWAAASKGATAGSEQSAPRVESMRLTSGSAGWLGAQSSQRRCRTRCFVG